MPAKKENKIPKKQEASQKWIKIVFMIILILIIISIIFLVIQNYIYNPLKSPIFFSPSKG